MTARPPTLLIYRSQRHQMATVQGIGALAAVEEATGCAHGWHRCSGGYAVMARDVPLIVALVEGLGGTVNVQDVDR